MSKVHRVKPEAPLRTLPSLQVAAAEGKRLKLGVGDENAVAGIQEIADELHVSKQRAQAILQAALFRFAWLLNERGLSFAALNPQKHDSAHPLHLPK